MEGEEDSFDQFGRDAPALHQVCDDNVLTKLVPKIEKIKVRVLLFLTFQVRYYGVSLDKVQTTVSVQDHTLMY